MEFDEAQTTALIEALGLEEGQTPRRSCWPSRIS